MVVLSRGLQLQYVVVIILIARHCPGTLNLTRQSETFELNDLIIHVSSIMMEELPAHRQSLSSEFFFKDPRSLCIEDDLWDLSVLYRGAIVVACSVAEGKASLGGRALVGHLPHAFSAVVRVWPL